MHLALNFHATDVLDHSEMTVSRQSGGNYAEPIAPAKPESKPILHHPW